MRHFRDAFYRAELFDYNAAESWELLGGQDSETRAGAKVQQLLREYEAPLLDEGIDEALRDFMARRKREIR